MKHKLPAVATSRRWCQLLKINPKDILDPKGWDRSSEDNFWYDFNNRMITEKMFYKRLSKSTVKYPLSKCQDKIEIDETGAEDNDDGSADGAGDKDVGGVVIHPDGDSGNGDDD